MTLTSYEMVITHHSHSCENLESSKIVAGVSITQPKRSVIAQSIQQLAGRPQCILNIVFFWFVGYTSTCITVEVSVRTSIYCVRSSQLKHTTFWTLFCLRLQVEAISVGPKEQN
jgi:hypothetical protein